MAGWHSSFENFLYEYSYLQQRPSSRQLFRTTLPACHPDHLPGWQRDTGCGSNRHHTTASRYECSKSPRAASDLRAFEYSSTQAVDSCLSQCSCLRNEITDSRARPYEMRLLA